MTPQKVDSYLTRVGLPRGRMLGPWQLSGAEFIRDEKDCGVRLEFTDQRAANRVIRVRLWPTNPDRPAFGRTRSVDLAYETVPNQLAATAIKLITALQAIVTAHDDGNLQPPEESTTATPPASAAQPTWAPLPPSTVHGENDGDTTRAFPTFDHRAHLARTTELPKEICEAFHRDGHVLVRNALDPDMLQAARGVVAEALGEVLQEQWAQHAVPVAARRARNAGSLAQITHLGTMDAAIRVLTRSRRIAKMAADLMGVPRVRIFCEDWFVKEPHADSTPWHQDSAGMPFDAKATITVWIPFQPVAEDNGLLRFARGSHGAGIQPVDVLGQETDEPNVAADLESGSRNGTAVPDPASLSLPPGVEPAEARALTFHIGRTRPDAEREPAQGPDPSEEAFAAIIRAHGWEIDVSPTMSLGDVSFHDGSTIHGGLPNNSDASRIAVALHCYADGAVLKEPTTAAMRNYRQMFAAALETGAPAASRLWPLIYQEDDPEPVATPVMTPPPITQPGGRKVGELPFVSAVIHYAGDIQGRGTAGPTDALDYSSTTLALEPRRVPIYDARPIQDQLSLDREGFVLVSHTSRIAGSPEMEELNRTHQLDVQPLNAAYHEEMAQLVRKVTGAREVLPQRRLLIVRFSHKSKRSTWAGPTGFAHLDYTETSAHQFLNLVLGWEGVTLLPYRRFAIYQTWRVTCPPPQDNLLAICDGQTVSNSDLIVIDTTVGPKEIPGNKFESRICKPNDAHRWFYFSNMRNDEVLLFKAFDSGDPTSNTALHAAFDVPNAPSDANPRASIETRLFAFFD